MMRSRAIREGSLGLFALLGLIIFSGITIWLRGGHWGQKSYRFAVDFDNVEGLQIGAPVRYRGVQIGKLVSLKPTNQGVTAILEVDSTELRIPQKGVRIETNRYGLIGEASIDITPDPSSALSSQIQAVNPLSPDCEGEDLIICNEAKMQGENGSQLMSSLVRLSETYSDPKFVENLNAATRNTAMTAAKIGKLSDNMIVLSNTAKTEISALRRDFSQTSRTINRTASDASVLVGNMNGILLENRQNINKTFEKTNQLMTNVNNLIEGNKARLEITLDNLDKAGTKLAALTDNVNLALTKLNSTLDAADTQKIMQDLQVVMANASEVSKNLKSLSETLNDPATILTLQQTLDAARATFENTQKITSDLDELTGDPELRLKLRRLIDGLSNLVSSSQQLEQQIQIAQKLESQQKELEQQVQIAVQNHCQSEDNKSSLSETEREKLKQLCNGSVQPPRIIIRETPQVSRTTEEIKPTKPQ